MVDPDGEEGRAWATAVVQSFHDGAPDDDWLARWRAQVRHDGLRLSGVWPERTWTPPADAPASGAPVAVSPPVAAPVAPPVATYASWTQSIDVGGGRVLPLHMVTDVTVAPTHRRRGLLRSLMTADLADAAARGLPLAALTASEGSIYGRFGFGPATRLRRVEVDTTRVALRRTLPADTGRLELVAPREAWPAISAVFADHLARTRGAVDRHQGYEPILTGAYLPWDRSPDRHAQVLLHLDADERPDGHAAFRWTGVEEGRRTVEVTDLLAATPEVELRLWSLLASMDLVERLRCDTVPVDWVLDHALVEPRAVRTTRLGDHLWLRVLDVPVALAARPWSVDGSVVLRVVDPLGHADGTWRVTVRDGVADATASADDPDAVLDADTLGSLYLGDVDVAVLAAAGRLGDARPEAVRTLGRMADGGPAPYCATSF